MRTTPSSLALFAVATLAATARAQDARVDSLDAFVKKWMARRHVAGLSLAIIDQGRIAVTRAYGVADESTRQPVTPATLFQAGSISKPVSALAALRLVEAGKLSLDEDVNLRLKTWKVPASPFTTTEKVTLRRLLSHSAGVTVHGFPGYAVDETVPTLVQVLDGVPPTNTAPIRVDTTPGAIWRYSGGGFTIMQQLLIDVTGTPFPELLQQSVLAPIGMTASSFAQPQPPARPALTASAYYADRSPVKGRWHLYPEMAAAGLWTTPTDLARFAIEIQEALAGKGHGVISQAMARQYLTEQKGGSGLGIGVRGTGPDLNFAHGGRDEGFDAQLIAFAETGQGVAVMINANDNSRMMRNITGFIARTYRWPNEPTPVPAARTGVPVPRQLLDQYAGWYEIAENQMQALVPNQAGTGLETYIDGFPDDLYLPLDSLKFGSSERPFTLTFSRNARGEVEALTMSGGPRQIRAARVVPLPSSVSVTGDARRTFPFKAVFDALAAGGTALESSPGLTAGAKRDFRGNGDPNLKELGSPISLGEENVVGRGIRRHGGEVALVRYFRVTTPVGERYLLVHLTADGLVTDYDLLLR